MTSTDTYDYKMADIKDSTGMKFTVDSKTKRLAPSITITDGASEVFSTRFSPDGRFLASGGGDGSIRVFNILTGRLAYNLVGGYSGALPTTAIRFRPNSDQHKTKNVLVAANAHGHIQHWHVTSGKCLHTIKPVGSNQIFAIDFNKDGSKFATAGKDKTVRVYDEATKTEIQAMKGGHDFGDNVTPGHSNRIFALKCHPSDSNLIVSAGWDNTVQIWDTRANHAVRGIYGPHICGDSIDILGNTMLTGSWRHENQLELWDFSTGKIIEQIPWNKSSSQPCMLYAAQFSKAPSGTTYIAAGGSGSNEAKIFDYSNGNKLVGTLAGLSRGVFSLDWSPQGDKCAIAGGDGNIRVIDVVDNIDESKMD